VLVLSIIGIIVVLSLIFLLAAYVGEYGVKHYGYELFTYQQFAFVSIPTVALYFGIKWFLDALKSDGDILNGLIVIGISILVLLYRVYYNFKHTNFLFGLGATLVQFGIFMPLSFFAFIALIMVVALLAETKPVYNLNSKD